MDEKPGHPLTRAIIYLVNKLWLMLATLIIVIALIFTLLRILLPQINYFKSDIERWIEREYQVEIEVERIDAEWSAAGPIFSLKNFKLKSNDGQLNLVELQSLSINLDALSSIITGRITTESITIAGVSLNFLLDRKLAVRLETQEDNQSNQLNEIQSTSQLLLNHLFGQKKLVVTDSTITLETLTGREFQYRITQLDINNFEDIHQIQGGLVDDKNGQLQLVAEIYGDPSQDSSHTNFYLQGNNVGLPDLPVFEKYTRLKPYSGKLNWRLWSDWQDGRWQSAVGDVQLVNVAWDEQPTAVKQTANNSAHEAVNQQLAGKQQDTPSSIEVPVAESASKSTLAKTTNAKTGAQEKPVLESLSAAFSWQYESANSGQLILHDTTLKMKQNPQQTLADIYAFFKQSSQQDIQWDIVTKNFQLAPLSQLAAVAFMDDGATFEVIQNADLQMNIASAGARFILQNGQWKNASTFATFDQLSYSPDIGLPQISHLTGDVAWVDGVGTVHLTAENTEADFKQLFRGPLTFDVLTLDSNWWLDEQGALVLQVDQLHAKNIDLELNARAHFFFQDAEPVLALYTELNDIDVSQKSKYLPSGIMSEALINYLDESVKSGQVTFAKSVVSGPLKSFPYADNSGLFAVLGFIQQSRYQYLPGWPMAENLSARLLFQDNGMDLQALGGNSGKVAIQHARAIIRDYSAKNIPFELTIDATSQDNSGREFLSQSPLKNIAKSIEPLDYHGSVRTKLAINLGLKDSSNLTLKGSIIPFSRAKLNIADYTFSDLQGVLNIDRNGVKKSHIKARYQGEPLQADIISGLTDADPAVSIEATGKLSAASISDIVGSEWKDFATGQSDFNAHIEVSPIEEDANVILNFHSNLQGLAIHLPGELNKSAEQKTPVNVAIRIADTSQVTLDWRAFSARWWWRQSEKSPQQLGGVFYYGAEKRLPDSVMNSYAVEMHLASTPLNSWFPIIEKITEKVDSTKLEEIPNTAIDVFVNDIENDYLELSKVHLSLAKKQQQNWQIDASGPLGNIQFKLMENEPWEVSAQQLKIKLKESLLAKFKAKQQKITDNSVDSTVIEAPPAEPQGDAWWVHPRKWQPMMFKCEACQVEDIYLGNLKLNLQAEDNQLNVSGNVQDGKKHQLVFNFNWMQQGFDESHKQKKLSTEEISNQSLLEFDLSSNDIGKLIKNFNYDSGIKDSSGHIIGKLSWQALPWDFELLKAQGAADFSLGEGYLSEVSDAKARLFSLLSLQSLSRRLQLDFSDIFKKGFFYNKLTGNITLSDRKLYSHNIVVDGSAAKVTLNGEMNLADRSVEQHALVLPQLTSSLPVLIGWAVEPTTGVLVYLLNKIFEPAIEVVTQIEYRIHGTLDEVEVDEIKKSKSKVKYDQPKKEEKPLKQKTPANNEPAPVEGQTPLPQKDHQTLQENQPPLPDERVQDKNDEDKKIVPHTKITLNHVGLALAY